jgi:RNA polymerase sigma-70 factor (ECF subfamily)
LANANKIRQEATIGSDLSLDELSLIQQVQAGDQVAFRLLWELHEAKVTRCAVNYLRNEADACEVANDVGFKLWGFIGDFRGECTLTTWLFRVTVNSCFDKLRERKRKESLNDPLDDQIGAVGPKQPRDWSQDLEIRQIAQRVFDRSKAEHQQAIELHFRYGESRQEIAARIGIKVKRVDDIIGIFLTKLRAESQTTRPRRGTSADSRSKTKKV